MEKFLFHSENSCKADKFIKIKATMKLKRFSL